MTARERINLKDFAWLVKDFIKRNGGNGPTDLGKFDVYFAHHGNFTLAELYARNSDGDNRWEKLKETRIGIGISKRSLGKKEKLCGSCGCIVRFKVQGDPDTPSIGENIALWRALRDAYPKREL